MLAKLTAIGTTLALLLPWTLMALRLLAGKPLLDRMLAGLVGGLAATITLGYLLAWAGWLELYWAVYGAALVGAAAAWRLGTASAAERAGEGALWTGGVLTLVLVAYAIPTFSTDFPAGWDPAFHCILARKILESGRLAADWQPFEEAPVNYTQGTHVLIAVVARWSGQPVHLVFQILHLIVQPLAVLLVGRLGGKIFGDSRAGVLSMLVYGLLCHYGSFSSYYQWGGLPTEIGSLFFLALVSTAFADDGRMSTALCVLLFGSLMVVHHLTALISTWVLAFYIGVAALTRAGGALPRQLARLFPLVFAAYFFYIIPYAVRVVDLGGTDALRYRYDTLKTGLQALQDLGPAAAILGIAGLALASRQLERIGGISRQRQEFLLCWLTALLLGFCLLGYVYRYGAYLLYGEDFTAFTPSRWLTVASYPLALYAGWGLSVALEGAACRLGQWLPRAAAERALLAAIIAATLLSSISDVEELASRRPVSAMAQQIGRMVDEHVPAEGFVLFDKIAMELAQPVEWIPYLTWRRTIYTPLPASEDRRAYREKVNFFNTGSLEDATEWIELHGMKAYMVYEEDVGTISVSPIERTAP